MKTFMLVLAGLVAMADVALACGSNAPRNASTRPSISTTRPSGTMNAGTPR